MTATAIQEHQIVPKKGGNGVAKYISWDNFKKKYLQREDKFKYEWLDGIVEKTPRTMNQNRYYIWGNLKTFLFNLNPVPPDLGEFLTGHLKAYNT